ncbi:efflux RND transporter periplasmic adaptor subunit [Thiosocius teredinicola]|uniref:efflux RND transporter periplasmic adaptor subunit n=1 Tax=Thiosocius teredinicola TaxID=1973002 RepID=UPI002FE4F8FB
MNTYPYRLRSILIVLLTALLVACSEPPVEPSESMAEASKDTALEHAQKHLDPKYVCPMHPQIVRDEPGSCPICGMDLVAKMIDAQAGKRPTVEISNAVINSMGVRTAPARNDTLWKYIETVGRIEYDETRLAHVHPRAEGWMEQLSLRAEGEPVKRGQVLGRLYSPEILSAQVDFLIALDQQAGSVRIEKARNRLRLLGVTEGTISTIQNSRKSLNTVPLVANASGVVTKLGAREGMYVTPNMEVVTIADLGKIWVLVDIYEHQIDWLAAGVTAEIKVPAYPGRTWEGKVEYIYPELDPKSRTLKVRLAFDNPDGLLKANMFADVVIYGGPKRDTLSVPAEAVITTGKRDTVVMALGEGRFQPVDVVTGMRTDDKVEILSGIKAGDEVVVSGQFLIDSESSLQASFLRMDDTGSAGSASHGSH